MKRWEYQVLLYEAEHISPIDLNEMGQEGWELVSVTMTVKQVSSHGYVPVESSHSESSIEIDNVVFCNAYFKRPAIWYSARTKPRPT